MLVLRASNIEHNTLVFTDNVFVDIEVNDSLIVRKDDILICVRNGSRNLIGKCALIDDRAKGMTFGAFMSIYRTKYAHFVFYLFQSELIKRQIHENIGATINQITNKNLNSFQIPFPKDENEQQAIAAALSDVDALIASLDQLIAKKRDIKQATMQQLLTGRTRLPGFSGGWEVKKLGEISEKFVNGGTPSTQKSEYWQGNIPWITGADIIDQKVSEIRRLITNEAVKNSSTNIVEGGNLLLVTRTGVGKLAIAPFSVAISQDITGIYVYKEQTSIEYLFHYFNYNSDALKSLNQGTSIAGITRETLLSTKVHFPSFSEQRAIATILSDMDAEIAALEQRRDKTRALKQGMMQELLTGKVRLR